MTLEISPNAEKVCETLIKRTKDTGSHSQVVLTNIRIGDIFEFVNSERALVQLKEKVFKHLEAGKLEAILPIVVYISVLSDNSFVVTPEEKEVFLNALYFNSKTGVSNLFTNRLFSNETHGYITIRQSIKVESYRDKRSTRPKHYRLTIETRGFLALSAMEEKRSTFTKEEPFAFNSIEMNYFCEKKE